MAKYYIDERELIILIDSQIKRAKRLFRFIITNDNDDSYIPKFKTDFIICDCSMGEDFTSDQTWKKYFDDNNRPVLFINTSTMFQQFENKAVEAGVDYGRKGAGLWAQYMYEKRFRGKIWEEKTTKYVFMVKEEDMKHMYMTVNNGFCTELQYYYMGKGEFIVERDFSMSDDNLIDKTIIKESSTNFQEQTGPVLKKIKNPNKK